MAAATSVCNKSYEYWFHFVKHFRSLINTIGRGGSNRGGGDGGGVEDNRDNQTGLGTGNISKIHDH